jgi:hypothetical protein
MRVAAVAAAGLLFAFAGAAGAQTVTQTLSVAFIGLQAPSPVPFASWLPAAAAGALAVAAAVVLRRRRFGRFSVWMLAAVGSAALLLEGTPVSEAGVFTTPLSLTSSPSSVQFTFPGAPLFNEVVATNNDLGAIGIQITNITLSVGPYIIGIGAAASKHLDPKFVGPPPCFVGMHLNKGASCFIDLQAST